MISSLGVQGSALGAGTFNLGTTPGAGPAPRQGAAFLAVKYVTGQRVSQVGVEATIRLAPPSVAVSQVAAEVTTRPSLPPVYLTQVTAEAIALPTPPPLNSTQVVMEAVIFAPPTRFGLASIMLARAGVRPGVASLRARGPNERERTGNASLWINWATFAGGGFVADPTTPPGLTGSATGGTLGPGTYQLGYTWVTPYGESRLSPISTVTLTSATSSFSATWLALPPGVLGVRLYVSQPDGTTLSQQNVTPLGGTSTTITAPPVDTGIGPPPTNTTAWSPYAVDLDFHDAINPTAAGPLGWQPQGNASPDGKPGGLVVVRSGEEDVGTLPPFRETMGQDGVQPQNPLVTSQLPPLGDPIVTFVEVNNVHGAEPSLLDPNASPVDRGNAVGLAHATVVLSVGPFFNGYYDLSGGGLVTTGAPVPLGIRTSVVSVDLFAYANSGAPHGPITYTVQWQDLNGNLLRADTFTQTAGIHTPASADVLHAFVQAVPPAGTVYVHVTMQAAAGVKDQGAWQVTGYSGTPGRGNLPLGTYLLGYTLVDTTGHESSLSPAGFVTQDFAALYVTDHVQVAVPNAAIYIQGFPLPTSPLNPTADEQNLAGWNLYMSQADGTTLTRQNTTTLSLSVDYLQSTTPTTTGAPAPHVSNWPEPVIGIDAAGRNWWDVDYAPTLDTTYDPTIMPQGVRAGWRYPSGGFHGQKQQNQLQGLAFFNPAWRGLPSAPILTDPAIGSGTSAKLVGTRLYLRHTWTQPGGQVTGDGVLVVRYWGKLDHVYVNGTEINAFSTKRLWGTSTIDVPSSVLRPGRNVLAIKSHLGERADQPSSGWNKIYLPNAVSVDLSGDVVRILSASNASVSNRDLVGTGNIVGSRLAQRPDGRSRQYWESFKFTAVGQGYIRGTASPGFLSWSQTPDSDDGPGLWGYFGNTHPAEYIIEAVWDGKNTWAEQVTPRGTRQIMLEETSPWPLRDFGFGNGDTFVKNVGTAPRAPYGGNQGTGFALGDTTYNAYADRENMISVGRIGGGGKTQMAQLHLNGSDEWGAGAAYLLAYPLKGGPSYERTVYNDMVWVDQSYPVDADPWNAGRVVATIPVTNPQQIFVSAVSRDPTIGGLGKARLWVNWLDANQQIGGSVASDNEFLHAAFGTQPATLWPYSENQFWAASYFGRGQWTSARYLQLVLFRHQDTPNQYNQWLIHVSVRESAAVVPTQKAFGQWVG